MTNYLAAPCWDLLVCSVSLQFKEIHFKIKILVDAFSFPK